VKSEEGKRKKEGNKRVSMRSVDGLWRVRGSGGGFVGLCRRTWADMGWPSDTTASCESTTSTLKSDIIEAWKRRKEKNHRKEAWKRHKKRRQLKLDRLKPVWPTSTLLWP
jgi:hypothetical protein